MLRPFAKRLQRFRAWSILELHPFSSHTVCQLPMTAYHTSSALWGPLFIDDVANYAALMPKHLI